VFGFRLQCVVLLYIGTVLITRFECFGLRLFRKCLAIERAGY